MKRGLLLGVIGSCLSCAVFAEEALKVQGETVGERIRWILDALFPMPKSVWITLLILAVLILGTVCWYQMGKEKTHGK